MSIGVVEAPEQPVELSEAAVRGAFDRGSLGDDQQLPAVGLRLG